MAKKRNSFEIGVYNSFDLNSKGGSRLQPAYSCGVIAEKQFGKNISGTTGVVYSSRFYKWNGCDDPYNCHGLYYGNVPYYWRKTTTKYLDFPLGINYYFLKKNKWNAGIKSGIILGIALSEYYEEKYFLYVGTGPSGAIDPGPYYHSSRNIEDRGDLRLMLSSTINYSLNEQFRLFFEPALMYREIKWQSNYLINSLSFGFGIKYKVN